WLVREKCTPRGKRIAEHPLAAREALRAHHSSGGFVGHDHAPWTRSSSDASAGASRDPDAAFSSVSPGLAGGPAVDGAASSALAVSSDHGGLYAHCIQRCAENSRM